MELRLNEGSKTVQKFVDCRSHSLIDEPDVSVIIPVFNAMPYLLDAVESVLGQKGVSLELICVDDGSSDGGIEFLLGLLGKSNFRLILQDNSGSPSAPRNRGIDIARGKYLYFLDADDILYDDALMKMVAEAEDTMNDQVLGKIHGIGGRSAMPQIFRNRSTDADLLQSYAWHNLSPTGKLVRKELVDSLHLRFNEDQWIGEDQIFFAELYLNGSGISILNDQNYVGIRYREDGGNVTSRQQSLSDKQKTLCRLAKVITKHCAEGEVRDQLAQRLFTSTMLGVFTGIYQSSSDIERSKFLRALQKNVTPLFTPRIEANVSKSLAIIIALIAHGHTRDVEAFIKELDRNGMRYVTQGHRLVVDTSMLEDAHIEGLNLELPKHGILKPKQEKLTCRSNGLQTAGSVFIPDICVEPTEVSLILRDRNTHEEVSISSSTVQYEPKSGGGGSKCFV